ncbi:TPA: transketolase [Candidatus Uhrbacteria bacterium]|uniref:Transketolase domain protein n=1 Tax=Candidatus Uhrbacteria bacterium GW2011_GWC2_53_7 TaxID=1618986 RepID=A0A0G1XUJ0_9BACT|nr:MAG: Transketolase domain protein [Candidatus Uhrbacteria bacterium GW2011_GWC2_53_7]OGL72696.1 MAG: transketolase [Candidatus Uhrbacteria bacterium RIFCSPHIGHO2_02_FULL_54_11]HBL39362.1 transketolase [Candidatus Uhrbacteria bacterium]
MTSQPLHIHDDKIAHLEEKANEIRRDLVKMLEHAGSGHSAGPLGMADIFTALYFHVLNHRPKQPNWKDRDRLILSNGHICPIRYVCMAHAGYFPKKELMTLRRLGTRLQGHPEKDRLPGVETTSGPLGEGLAQAAGMAYAARMNDDTWRVFCVTGDGELQEGICWESLLFIAKEKLANLTIIVDRNQIQIDGFVEDVTGEEPLRDKFESFGFHVIEIDGHNIEQFVDATEEARAVYKKPSVIIANTIPGKGVDFMEKKFEWHGKPPNPKEARSALAQLRTLGGTIQSEHE